VPIEVMPSASHSFGLRKMRRSWPGRRARLAFEIRDGFLRHEGGGEADRGDDQEHDAPAHVVAQPGAGRHAHHVGEGQPGKHAGQRRRFLALVRQARGDHGADAEEGAVRQARQEAEQHHRVEVRREGRQRVEGGKHQHEPDQHAARRTVASMLTRVGAPTTTPTA
jgi:hypothetical protein